MDLVELDYLSALEDLTFNSKPIIHTLTYIAQENEPYAISIVNAIEKHIQKCPPNCKLPALYLLDSISKNLGAPYTYFFGLHLFSTFMSAYTVVEPRLRLKLDQLLATWKQRPPNSSSLEPVFSPIVTAKIENALLKYKSTILRHQSPLLANSSISSFSAPIDANINSYSSFSDPASSYKPSLPSVPFGFQHISGTSPSPGFITLDSLLSDVNRMIVTEQARFIKNPYDNMAKKRFEILLQLKNVLSSSALPYDQLLAIKNQLAQLEKPASPSTSSVATSAPSVPSALSSISSTPFMKPSIPSTIPTIPSAYSASVSSQPPLTHSYVHPGPQSHKYSLSSGPPASLYNANALTPEESSSIDSLFANLQAAGLVPPSAGGKSQGPQASCTEAVSLTADIDLSKSSLATPRPKLSSLLYENYSNQCANCGRRYGNDPESRKELDKHSDWHFRINKRIRESSLHGINRCWFVMEEEWVNSKEEEDLITETAQEIEEQRQKQMESVRSQYVLTPLDPIAASEPCPICQEKFQSVWHEEAEVWVFMNAVEKEGRIFHATCLQEVRPSENKHSNTNTSTQNLAEAAVSSNIKNATGDASKDSQPDVQNLLQGIDIQSILQALGKRKERDDSMDSMSSKVIKQESK